MAFCIVSEQFLT